MGFFCPVLHSSIRVIYIFVIVNIPNKVIIIIYRKMGHEIV